MKEREAERLLDDLIKHIPDFMNTVINKISKGMNSILNYLIKNNERLVSAGEIAAALSVSTARVAFALNTLEKKGLIYKFKDKNDSRVTLVSISRKGKELIENSKKSILEDIMNIVDKIGEKDFREFIRISSNIKKALEV